MSQEQTRVSPQSDIDFNYLTTDSAWGRPDVPQELKDKLSKFYQSTDKEGQVTVSKESLWATLGFYTRDIRLANLSEWNGELKACRYWLDLAGDYLSVDMVEPFLICLSRSATMLETSQSKGGFLRRIMNTLTHHNINSNQEPAKKGFFGGNSEQGGRN